MSRKYAAIDDFIVTEILNLDTDEQYAFESKYHQLIIDIEDLYPEPEIGWKLVGNIIEAPAQELTDDERDKIQQETQRKFGAKLVITAMDEVGARNLKLYREGSPVNITSLASQMASVKLLLEGGALKTARSICSALVPAYPSHADILISTQNAITTFLVNNGYE